MSVVRHNAHKALVELEWLDNHVAARDTKWDRAVVNHIGELRARIMRIVNASDEAVGALESGAEDGLDDPILDDDFNPSVAVAAPHTQSPT